MLGSGAEIIRAVKWFSQCSTPKLRNKTNQENYHFDFDQSAKAERRIRPISGEETPGANQDFGINHIIRWPRKVTYWYTMIIAFCNGCLRIGNNVMKISFFNVLRDREAQKIGTFHTNANENIAHMMHWQSILTTILIPITKWFHVRCHFTVDVPVKLSSMFLVHSKLFVILLQ